MLNHELTAISDKFKEFSSIPNIDNGGCGIVAFAMYYWLSKQYPHLTVNIYYQYSLKWVTNEEFTSELQSIRTQTPTAPNHVYISIDGFFFDSEGHQTSADLYELGHKPELRKSVSIDYLTASVRQQNCWNSDFNRAHLKKCFRIVNFRYVPVSKALSLWTASQCIKSIFLH